MILINLLLDRSGSMESVRQETISSFNEYKNSFENKKGVRFTLMTFDSESIDTLVLKKKIEDVPDLNAETYQPRAGTPLYDSIATLIKTIEDNKTDKDKVLAVIYTDGYENMSREFNRDQIFKLIKKKQEEKWSFVFLGSNQDAWGEGENYGFVKGNTASLGIGTTSVENAFFVISGSHTLFENSDGNYTETLVDDVIDNFGELEES